MSRNELSITVNGNLTADPDLRFTPSGTAVATFTVAFTPRRFDRESGQWIDGETTFMPVTCFRELAEHVAETLTKGARVVVTGQLVTERWEKEGQQRSTVKVMADDVAASLLYATATIQRMSRSNGSPAPADPVTGEAATLRTRPASQQSG